MGDLDGGGEPRAEGHLASLSEVARLWTRLGSLGFGGPPTHIALLRRLCVEERRWLDDADFEEAVAACNLLPGPASTQLAIYCAWRVRGRPGALVGALGFILPGFVLITALSALFLSGSPPEVVLGAGAGAGAAVAAVAVRSGVDLLGPSWQRTVSRARWVVYVAVGAVATVLVGPRLVLVLLACGVVELVLRGAAGRPGRGHVPVAPLPVLATGLAAGTLASLSWVALKVGALSYGGGFVIIPLMQADAVDRYGWMTDAEFLNAVALGQVTPGPVVLTVAVVGYAAAGAVGAALAALVAFSPSFLFIVVGGTHFDRLRADRRAQAFLGGAGPAAIGAILGAALPLATALSAGWQVAVLATAGVLLLVLRREIVPTLLAAGVAGAVLVGAGAPLPS